MRILVSAALMAAAAAALPQAAQAQSAQEIIDACRATASDAERIACLEAALIEDDNDGLRIPLPFGGGGNDTAEAAAPAAQIAAGAAAGAAAPAADPAQAMGAEQVAVREGTFDDPEPAGAADDEEDGLSMQASIVRTEMDRGDILVVQLDNGQVWRQVERDAFPIRLDLDEPQPVVITTSGFGGYRMRIVSLDRRIAVERIR